MLRSKYRVTKICEEKKEIYLIDLNGDKSVTNDAENVYQEVYREGYKIIYRDSMGCWDEMLMENGIIQFRPIQSHLFMP